MLSDKANSNEKMSRKPMRLLKKVCDLFLARFKRNLVDKSLGINKFSG